MEYIVKSPLHVWVGGKNPEFPLNLNAYRNTHYQILSKAKRNYNLLMWEQLQCLPFMERITLHFILHRADNRVGDRANVLSVTEKFFCDAMVIGNPHKLRKKGKKIVHREGHIIHDDNDKYILYQSYETGAVDREYPRVDIIITDLGA